MGPILYIVVTDKINIIGKMCCTTYGPEIRISNLLYIILYLLYIDDILGVAIPMAMENS